MKMKHKLVLVELVSLLFLALIMGASSLIITVEETNIRIRESL